MSKKMEQKPGKRQNAVKIYMKLILPIVFCIVMVYSSCRKSENTATPSTSSKPASNAALSGQVAVNLAKSLAGHFGGVNLMDGVDSVSVADHDGPHHGYFSSALCGFFTDSLVNYSHKEGDTLCHTGGNLTFYFDCKDGKPAGYTAYDSLNTVRTDPKHVYQYTVKQYYTIKCLDDKHLFVGVNGDIYFYNSTTTFCSCHSTDTVIKNA